MATAQLLLCQHKNNTKYFVRVRVLRKYFVTTTCDILVKEYDTVKIFKIYIDFTCWVGIIKPNSLIDSFILQCVGCEIAFVLGARERNYVCPIRRSEVPR